MDIQNMLAELRLQRDQIDSAIAVLQQLAIGGGKRRGRPPGWLSAKKTSGSDSSSEAPKRRGRPPGSKNLKKKASGE